MLRVANAILKRLPQQAAVLNDGGSLPKSLSALGRSVLIENERKAQKAAWIGVVDADETKIIVLTFIPPLLGACKVFGQCPVIALSSKMCHPSYYFSTGNRYPPPPLTPPKKMFWPFFPSGVTCYPTPKQYPTN